MEGPWQVVDPGSAAWMAKGALRLWMECPIIVDVAWEAGVLGVPCVILALPLSISFVSVWVAMGST